MSATYLISIYSISYLLFFALLQLSKEKKGLRLLDAQGPATNRAMLITLHCGGIILFGAIPALMAGHSLQQLLFGSMITTVPQMLVTAVLVMIAILIAPVIADKNHRRSRRSQRSCHPLNFEFVLNYFLVRLLFLVAYEVWFRGWLLTDCIIYWNTPFTIFINVVLYAGLHAVNGKEEVVACVPFGLLLCLLSIWTNTAWPAVFIHVAFTLSYEVRLVKKNNRPSTQFI